MKMMLSTVVGLMLLAPVALHAEPPPHAGVWEHKKHHMERHREARKWHREREREAHHRRREHWRESHRHPEYRVHREYHYYHVEPRRYERPHRHTDSKLVIHLDL